MQIGHGGLGRRRTFLGLLVSFDRLLSSCNLRYQMRLVFAKRQLRLRVKVHVVHVSNRESIILIRLRYRYDDNISSCVRGSSIVGGSSSMTSSSLIRVSSLLGVGGLLRAWLAGFGYSTRLLSFAFRSLSFLLNECVRRSGVLRLFICGTINMYSLIGLFALTLFDMKLLNASKAYLTSTLQVEQSVGVEVRCRYVRGRRGVVRTEQGAKVIWQLLGGDVGR